MSWVPGISTVVELGSELWRYQSAAKRRKRWERSLRERGDSGGSSAFGDYSDEDRYEDDEAYGTDDSDGNFASANGAGSGASSAAAAAASEGGMSLAGAREPLLGRGGGDGLLPPV